MPTILRLGSPDHVAVKNWQATLVRLDLPPGPNALAVDGVFGPKTDAATKAFQRAAGIDPDGVVGPETRAAAEAMVHCDVKPENLIQGIDVSVHQGAIDWVRVARAGKAFAWIKLSEGVTLVDKRGAANWAGAREAGLLVGGYQFLTTSSPAETQARRFLELLPAGGTLPPMIDAERGAKGGTPRPAAVLAFARVLEEGLRARCERYVRPWIYTGPAYALDYLQGAPGLGDYNLIDAHYGVSAPSVPPPWEAWAGWQYTDKGVVEGIAGPVDLDVLKVDALAAAR